MEDFARRLVLDAPFARTLEFAARALEARGFEVATTLDVREMVRRRLKSDCRAYSVLLVWAPDLVFEALKYDLDAGTLMPWHVAVYELADGESAVAVDEPLGASIASLRWDEVSPRLAQIAIDVEGRLAQALSDVTHQVRAGVRTAEA